jgi:hypothetical protein
MTLCGDKTGMIAPTKDQRQANREARSHRPVNFPFRKFKIYTINGFALTYLPCGILIRVLQYARTCVSGSGPDVERIRGLSGCFYICSYEVTDKTRQIGLSRTINPVNYGVVARRKFMVWVCPNFEGFSVLRYTYLPFTESARGRCASIPFAGLLVWCRLREIYYRLVPRA